MASKKTRGGAVPEVGSDKIDFVISEKSHVKQRILCENQSDQKKKISVVKPISAGNSKKSQAGKSSLDNFTSVTILPEQDMSEAVAPVHGEPAAKKPREGKSKETNYNTDSVVAIISTDVDAGQQVSEGREVVERFDSSKSKARNKRSTRTSESERKKRKIDETDTKVLLPDIDESINSGSIVIERVNKKFINPQGSGGKKKQALKTLPDVDKDVPVVEEVKSSVNVIGKGVIKGSEAKSEDEKRKNTDTKLSITATLSDIKVLPVNNPLKGGRSLVDSNSRAKNTISGNIDAAEEVSKTEIAHVESSFAASPPDAGKELPKSNKKFIGAHVSIAGGLWNAIHSTQEMGGKALGLFLKSQRTWKSKPMEMADVKLFKETLANSGISPWMVVPHGSYLMNCGSPDEEILRKSRDHLLDELQRCEQLGLPIYNFHPGSSKGLFTRSNCINRIAETINLVHSCTKTVITVVENMSGQKNTIGGSFTELREIIDLVHDKSRIGVCLDTCHAFAAGYDLKSEEGYEKVKAEFDRVIGRKYLRAVHLNDSKGELGCNLDRHENIGKGKLGLETFRRIMNDPFFNDVPMVLETPECDYSREIKVLYDLQEAVQ